MWRAVWRAVWPAAWLTVGPSHPLHALDRLLVALWLAAAAAGAATLAAGARRLARARRSWRSLGTAPDVWVAEAYGPAVAGVPTSAVASAGASFTPSPTIATRLPPVWNLFTAAALSAGRTSAATSSIPIRRATESATVFESPVIIATRIPSR